MRIRRECLLVSCLLLVSCGSASDDDDDIPVLDADGDGVPAAEDCDDGDPSSTVVSEDVDCDGVATGDDCDDSDPANTYVLGDCLPTLGFSAADSSATENSGSLAVAIVLSRVGPDAITVDFAVTAGTARDVDLGTGRDYTLASGSLEIPAGEQGAELVIELVDDEFYEADETLELSLSTPVNAELDGAITHSVTIVDDDRPNLFAVSDYGALGDGTTDDTVALQAAGDALRDAGGGVLLFAPGTYVVTQVVIYEGISYVGEGTTLFRPDRATLEAAGIDPHWVRTFTTTPAAYSGEVDSRPLIVQGLDFDGNRPQMGAYQNWELEHAALIFLNGNIAQPGRLRAYVEDCDFVDGVGDAIDAYANVDITVDNCQAENVFRGGFALNGGYSQATVTRLTTWGDTDPTGIDIEVAGAGYGNSMVVDVVLDALTLLDGELDIGVRPGSTVLASNIVADAPFNVFAPGSLVHFTDSVIKVGATDHSLNRIVCPGEVRFERCDLIATRRMTANPTTFFAVLDVFWQTATCEEMTGSVQTNQLVELIDSRLLVDDNFNDDDLVYAIYSVSNIGGTGNELRIEGGCISEDFDEQVVLYHSTSVVPYISPTTGVCTEE